MNRSRITRLLIATPAAILAVVAYTWLALPDVRDLRRTNPTTTAFMRLRAREAASSGSSQRQLHRWVSYNRISPALAKAVRVTEDAAFWDHDGIDLGEIRASIQDNLTKGTPLRGASTITQQLARNLFLSRDKSFARKAQEAALALMMDAAVPKTRILEIYLNVIEWGPGLYGLGPASRHYFGKDPSQLTTKEMAFLVCLIPSPVRYHSAHSAGRVGPGMDELMQNLLAKMYEAGALGEEECLRASEEELAFAPEDAGTARTEG
jgi:penicillin-binding protein 1A